MADVKKATLIDAGDDKAVISPYYNLFTSDGIAWVLVTIPILTCFAEMYKGPAVFVFAFVANALLCQTDEWQLKHFGFKGPSAWLGTFIPPVYLWYRGSVTGGGRALSAGWVVSMVVAAAVSYSEANTAVESAAMPLVTQIIREHEPNGAICVRVRVTETVSYGYYRAVATLSNGNDLRIMIETRGKSISVVVSP